MAFIYLLGIELANLGRPLNVVAVGLTVGVSDRDVADEVDGLAEAGLALCRSAQKGQHHEKHHETNREPSQDNRGEMEGNTRNCVGPELGGTGQEKDFSLLPPARPTALCRGSIWKPSVLNPRERVYGLAAGSETEMDIPSGQIECMGEFVGAAIVFGDVDVKPLLGVAALESVGIEVDPSSPSCTRLPTVRMRGRQPRGK